MNSTAFKDYKAMESIDIINLKIVTSVTLNPMKPIMLNHKLISHNFDFIVFNFLETNSMISIRREKM